MLQRWSDVAEKHIIQGQENYVRNGERMTKDYHLKRQLSTSFTAI